MESKSLKIAIVVNTAWNIYNFRLGLICALISQGHEVIAIAPSDEYVQQIKETGASFIALTSLQRKGTNPFKELKLVYELYQIYKKESIDLALHYTIKPNIYGSFAAYFARVKSLCTVTGLGYTFISKGLVSKIAKQLYKWAFRRSSMIAFQNNDDRQLFIDQGLAAPEKTTLIKGSGIRTDLFCPMSKTEVSDKFVFLFVGRLLFDKGVQEYLAAAEMVWEKAPQAIFWIVGSFDEGNPSAISPAIIEAAEEKGFIKYFGHSDQVDSFIRESDVVVLPSYREGLPRVMLEALSMAKPVITTDAAGCRETVVDGLNGYMVPLKDAASLAVAMQKMLDLSSEKLDEMGAKGRKMALEEFDEKTIIKRYLSIIDELCYTDNSVESI